MSVFLLDDLCVLARAIRRHGDRLCCCWTFVLPPFAFCVAMKSANLTSLVLKSYGNTRTNRAVYDMGDVNHEDAIISAWTLLSDD